MQRRPLGRRHRPLHDARLPARGAEARRRVRHGRAGLLLAVRQGLLLEHGLGPDQQHVRRMSGGRAPQRLDRAPSGIACAWVNKCGGTDSGTCSGGRWAISGGTCTVPVCPGFRGERRQHGASSTATTTKRSRYYPKQSPASSRIVTPFGGGSINRPVTSTTSDGASIPNMIFNLVKSIVGAGVLGLPAGVAAFGSTKLALIPSVILISIIGMLSGYCFSLIGRICAYTSSVSYRQAWERSVSSKSSWIPALACFMVTSCSVLAYSMILSDTLPTLVGTFTPYTITRTQSLLGVTSVALLPLCLMKSLKALAPFSLVGIIGMIYTSIAMAYRYYDGSYKAGGQFIDSLSTNLAPKFAEASSTKVVDLITNPKIFILVSMLSTAYMVRFFSSSSLLIKLFTDKKADIANIYFIILFSLLYTRLITIRPSSIGNFKTTL